MAKRQKPKVHKPTSYELLCQRVQRAINAPRAQREGTVTISREADENEADWHRMLEELETIEEVTLVPLDDGCMRLRWSPQE
uniref:DUF1654 domain-containing protein n=1 Tax=Halomonas sp. TaxID=1486246 RepID=UPI0026230FD3|nr:DUF1654 domain-containing protein [Halomonas sp.]